MPNMPVRTLRRFVHLRAFSTYSPGAGLSTPAEICRFAARNGYDAVALTDINGTYGYVELHRAARAAGIRPIYGVYLPLNADVSGAERPGERYSLILIALDRDGLRFVCECASAATVARESGRGFAIDDIADAPSGVAGVLTLRTETRTDAPEARHALAALHARFAENACIEILGDTEGDRIRDLTDVAASFGVRPVLTQDVRYVGPEKPQLADLVGRARDRGFEHNVHSVSSVPPPGRRSGMATPDEASPWYDDAPEAYTHALRIAASVERDLLDSIGTRPHAPGTLPMFDGRGVGTAGFEERMRTLLDRRVGDSARRARLRRHLDAELRRVARGGLEEPLLQFHEVLQRVRRMGMTPGPATGMAQQSLCAWLLDITGFNPYDIDAHFVPAFAPGSRRVRTLEIQIAPEDHPAVMAALGHLFDGAGIGYVPAVEHITAARALRMVAETTEIDKEELDIVLKSAADYAGASLRRLVEDNRRVASLYRRSTGVHRLITHAAAIEGLPYGFIRSRRTVIVSPHALRDFVGYTIHPDSGDRFVQATRRSFPIGRILRIDIAVSNALALCNDTARDAGGDAAAAAADGGDDELRRAIAANDLDGVYLLDAPTARRQAVGFAIADSGDLVVFLALLAARGAERTFAERVSDFRAGPGRYVDDPFAAAASAVTHGWIFFDDQVRDVIAALTGLSAMRAERLRNRFRRHTPAELADLRATFMRAGVEHDVPLEAATAWFTRLLILSQRTVSRQRMIAEAMLIRRQLGLRARHPLHWMAARLNRAGRHRSLPAGEDVVARLLPADVNASGRAYRVEGDRIRAPLYAVAGVSRATAAAIVRARGRGRFAAADEFRAAIAEKALPEREIEALTAAGALESAGISPATKPPRAEKKTRPRQKKDVPQPTLALFPEESSPEAGNLSGGYRVLSSLSEFYPHPSAHPVELAGRIRDLHKMKTGSGKHVAFFELFDATASVRVFAPWERIVPSGGSLNDGDAVIVRGHVRTRGQKKVCDALEVKAVEGGRSDGERSTDQSAEGHS